MEKITSIEKYISAVMKIKNERAALGLPSYQWFFRGQKDTAWSIVPSAFREDKLQNEYSLIQNAIRQNPFEFRSLNEFEILTKLQHYGLGTRLLDVTLNPLVALYFATEPAIAYEKGKDGRYKQVEKDGAVYYNHIPWHSVEELCAKIAMYIPFIDFEKYYTVEKLLEHLHEKQVISQTDKSSLERDDYKLFIEYIQDSFFIIPTHSNDRLTRQSGAFILPTAIQINKDNNKLKDRYTEKAYQDLTKEFQENFFVIPSKYKVQIREELDFFNINEATMFPELEHQMCYIQNKSSNVVGQVPVFQTYEADISLDDGYKKYNDRQPDIKNIIEDIIPSIPDLIKKNIINEVERETEYIDWKNKEQIKSRIRLCITKNLQNHYSDAQSREYANHILELLLNPTGKYAKEN